MRGFGCALIALRVSAGSESLSVHSTGSPDRAAQPAAGIANSGLSAGATTTDPDGSPATCDCSLSIAWASDDELAPGISLMRLLSGLAAASPMRITCAPSSCWAPDGASSSSASALAVGSSPPSEKRIGACSGRLMSWAAEIAVRQSA